MGKTCQFCKTDNDDTLHSCRECGRSLQQYDAFISYRRDTGSQLAVAIHTQLNAVHGIPTFLDVADLRASRFDNQLKQRIQETPNFILLLTPGALDRCNDENDWVRQEIALAIKTHRNIIPVMVEDFSFPLESALPEDIKDVVHLQRVDYVHKYYGASIDRIVLFLGTDNTDQNAPLPKAIKESQTMKENSNKSPSQTAELTEQKFINALQIACDDIRITEAERDKLNCLAMDIGISPARAKELEAQVRNAKAVVAQQPELSPQAATETPAPMSSCLEWPEVGHEFLKEIKRTVDVALLPFKPITVSSDEDIEEEKKIPELDWSINDILYFAVWFSRKHGSKVDISCGFFSGHEKRDPVFRTSFDPSNNSDLNVYSLKDLLNEDGDIVLNDERYFFEPDRFLGFIAMIEKLDMSELNQDLVQKISQQVIVASNTFWPVVRKNYD